MAVNAVNTPAATPPSKSQQGQNALDKTYSDFLRLLTTQLQNQDPTNPMDTMQMTQQIATLSQVEQQLNTNRSLEQLIALYGQTQYNSVAGYLGKEVEAPGNQGAVISGKGRFVYYMQSQPTNFGVTVKNADGAVVYTAKATQNAEGNFVWTDAAGVVLDPPPNIPMASGRNAFVWNGKNNNGQQLADGTYTISVDARDASNNAIPTQTYVNGIVTSIDSAGGQVYVSFGDISLPLTSVTTLRQPEQQPTI